MLRPPVANARLRKLSDGRVELTLKRPMHDGTRAIALTPSQLLRRLAAIVPPPRVHALRYFGALAPNAKLRPLITRGGRPPTMPDALDDGGAVEAQLSCELAQSLRLDLLTPAPPPMPERKRYLDWSELLRRTFGRDVLRCDKCGGRKTVVAFVTEPNQAGAILEELGIDGTGPPLAPARPPPHQADWCDPASPEAGIDPTWPD
jgi:hypothetical protein